RMSTTQVEFLGFRVDKDGIKPTCEKVEAIQKAPPPRNKTELQAFLGLLNFYSCFLPNKATWGVKHETAYVQTKQLLQMDKMLAHYDEKKPLAVVCDASPYGLGALLFHLERDALAVNCTPSQNNCTNKLIGDKRNTKQTFVEIRKERFVADYCRWSLKMKKKKSKTHNDGLVSFKPQDAGTDAVCTRLCSSE
uniref:Reverse transcriptase/retrotransposon-derived protein RNase H-like domain-containing protein n=1 Tax=Sinocyclocheilus anshuiensis TaxID=1608454 RepID=A0A671TD66_9TELE